MLRLLADLRERGIRLWLEGDRLRYSAPQGAMTSDLRDQLVAHKSEIIMLLHEAASNKPALPPPIKRLPRDGYLPLSFAQQRLWFLDQIAPGNAFYNVPAIIPMTAVDVDALEYSLNEIVRRHETLRTTFSQIEGNPVQVIAPQLSVKLDLADLRRLPMPLRLVEARKLAAKEAQQPFNLATGPLMRTVLLRLGINEYVLVLTLHHIVSDGWSMDIFFNEFTTLYEARISDRPSPFPELSIQYADFAAWQREWLSGETLESHLAYWRQQLVDLPILELPTTKRRPTVASFRGAYHPFELPQEIAVELLRLSHQESVTLFMTLLAAYKCLLYRYTHQEDVVVGAPVAGRNHTQIEQLIGFFVNTLVLRTNVGGNPTFRELLVRVRQTTIDAYSHQDVPFEKLVDELQPERDLSRNPLCQVTFQLWHTNNTAYGANEQQDAIKVERTTAIFDLSFRLWEYSDGIRGGFEYSTDLFEASFIERLAKHYDTLLHGIVADPDTPLADLPLMTTAEQRRMLVDWNATAVDFPQDACLHHLFEQQVARTPEAVALIFGDQQLTYAALERRANQLAHQLQELGVRSNVCVAVFMERSPEMVIALLAVLKAGGAYVPIDPDYPVQRIAYMLQDARAPVLLTQEHLSERLPELTTTIIFLDEKVDALVTKNACPPGAQVTAQDLAYVIYTSGSTGQPKGAMIPHSAICNHMFWMQADLPLTNADRVLQKTPFSFDASIWEFYAPLFSGATLVMAPPGAHADITLLMDTIIEHEITILQLVPSLLRLILHDQPKAFKQCTTLRRVFCGGEALTTDLVKEFFNSSEAELINLYGPTEAAIDSTFWRCDRDENRTTMPIGRPIANAYLYILDEYLQPVPIDVPGELYIGGAGVAKGYLNRPQLTDEKFIPDPFAAQPQARLYKTGDITRYRADGAVEFLERRDHQVKLHGFRIELGEIEAVLRDHPAISAAVTAVHCDQGGDQLIAYVVQDPSYQSAVEQSDEQQWYEEHVARWQEVYDHVVYNDAYNHISVQEKPTRNFVGWDSSYTHEPLPLNEMEEWLDETVARIQSHRPQRILELGCGTGALLFRIAPQCLSYYATDFSQSALNYIRHVLDNGQHLDQVSLAHKTADNFSDIPTKHFEMVLLNSVIQYFPSVDYLLQVLQGAVSVTKPGGTIFIGDVRCLPLLEAYHASVELYNSTGELPAKELKQRIQQRLSQEQELVIDPIFFTHLPEQFPRISHVRIQPKKGRYDNELSRYRYDVTLFIEDTFDSPAAETWDWQLNDLSFVKLRQHLHAQQPDRLMVTGIPNRRIAPDLHLLSLLEDPEPPATAAQLRTQMQEPPLAGLDLEDIWQLGHELPYRVDLAVSLTNRGAVDALFVNENIDDEATLLSPTSPKRIAWNQLANNPLQGMFTHKLVPYLRRFMQEQLPEYMIPSTLVLLNELPYMPNGKVDRNALPPPHSYRPVLSNLFIPPRTPIEEVLGQIWQEVLGVERISIRDDFFQQGGHSLLAVQVVSRIREALHVELPLRSIFSASKLEELALLIEEILVAEAETLSESDLQLQN